MKLNNERLPNKNVKPFSNGRPLCDYIFNTLLKVESIDEIYVYCSDEKIKAYIPKDIRFLQRSPALDLNTTKINEVLRSFAKDVPADVYVLAHTTAPFINHASIQKGLNAVVSGEYDSAFAAKRIQSFLWKNGRPLNYELDNIPRTQDLTPVFEETCGFYIYKRSLITEYNRRIGDAPFLVEVADIESIDIDNLSDFEFADALIKANMV